jgi:hypothetical protein
MLKLGKLRRNNSQVTFEGSGRGMSGGAGGRQAGLARVRVAAQLS